MTNNINKTFCENTIKAIDRYGFFKAWNPDKVAKRLNDYLGEEKYIGYIKSGLVFKIVD